MVLTAYCIIVSCFLLKSLLTGAAASIMHGLREKIFRIEAKQRGMTTLVIIHCFLFFGLT